MTSNYLKVTFPESKSSRMDPVFLFFGDSAPIADALRIAHDDGGTVSIFRKIHGLPPSILEVGEYPQDAAARRAEMAS